MNEKIHIALAFYDKTGEHSKFAGTTIVSVFENTNKSNWQNIVIHILHDETLTIENKNKFIQLVDAYNGKINFYNINIDEWCVDKENLENTLSRVSIGTLYRLTMPKILKNIEKVIYLDTDILVNCDIKQINDIDIRDWFIAAVLDNEYMRKLYVKTKYYQKAGLDYNDYFNAGVLLMNLTSINKNIDLLKESISILNKYKKFSDQDVLNIIFKNRTLFVDDKLNNLINIQNIKENELKDVLRRQAILHFAGYLKPWNCANKEIIKLYYSYMAKTPWIKNNDDIIAVMSDISNEYNRKMDLKNCLYYKQVQGISDKFLLGMKLVLNEKIYKRFLKTIRKFKLKLYFK